MRIAVAGIVAFGVGVGGAPAVAWADGFPGAGAVAGRAKLTAKGCGKVKTEVAFDVAVDPEGTWRIDDGGTTLAGSGAVSGKGRRRLVLSPDAESLTALVATVAAEASAVCGAPVVASEASIRKALLKVNAKGTRARLVVVLKASGVVEGGGESRMTRRLRAGGPWAGPLSCDEIFACTRRCALGDDPCAEACLAQGTLATQESVVALNDCVDALCPGRDPVCVAEALAGTCREEYEACVPPPPPTGLDCEEILECAEACVGQGCVDDCYARGSDRGRAEATAVRGCVARVCPTGGAACETSAIAGACAWVWEDCTGTPPPRNLACDAILDCMATCAAGDAGCLADCRERGSASGVTRLDALDACIDAACPTRELRCVANTVTGQCKIEWETCFS